jgi:FtsP/CotA-like multicopper oxidase with cupredoxin domain
MYLHSVFAIYLAGLSSLATIVDARNCSLHTHDESFVPDIILRVASESRNIAGIQQDVPIVNGTYPGPKIELQAGKTTWVRVWNDMPSDNLTMVRVIVRHASIS